MNFLSTLGYGGMVTVIGLIIVFLMLTLIIIAISVMAKAFKAFTERGAKKAEEPAPAPAPVPVAEPEVVEEVAEDDPALIAVIAAAIAAFDNSGKNIVVRKVRKVSGWNRAARAEQVTRF